LVFALTVSAALMPMISDRLPVLPADMGDFIGLLLLEIGIGVFFGVIVRIILLGVQTAGSVLALQIGIASALVSDPTTQQQAAVTGNFLLALTIVLIFATGLDHMTLKGLVGTYAIFPPGQLPPMSDVADHASRIVADSFAVAIAMAAPFLVYGMVFAVALGLLARLMPTLQVFFIAMPMQILAGFALMAVSLTGMMLFFLSSYEERVSLFLGDG
jgi:flagellar biosynthetic protein FliR